MNVENFEQLKEALYRKGFGESLYGQLEQQMNSGKPDFMLEHQVKISEDNVGFRLHFRRDETKDKVYFNSYDAAIFNLTDTRGQLLEQNFQTDKLITANEAYRMLKYGDLVAVNKTLFNKDNQQYNTWLSLDAKAEKNEYGNFPLNSYHENYYKKQPFVLGDALNNLPVPVKELESQRSRETIEKALKKANPVNITFVRNGAEESGYLGVNAKIGRVDVYDANFKLVEREGQRETIKEANAQDNPVQQQEDLKKKSSQNQKVNWENKRQPGKGVRF